MEATKKSRRQYLVTYFLILIGILIYTAVPDYSFAMSSLIFARSSFALPVILLAILVIGGLFFSLLSFVKGKSYKKKQPKAGGKARWFIGLSGKEHKSTKRQIFQLYDF